MKVSDNSNYKKIITVAEINGWGSRMQRKGETLRRRCRIQRRTERSQVTRWSDDHGKYCSWQPHTDINDTSHLRARRGASVRTSNCTYKADKSSLLLYDYQKAKCGDALTSRCDGDKDGASGEAGSADTSTVK